MILNDENAIRGTIQAVIDQAKADPAYMERVMADPRAAFAAAGLDMSIAEQISDEMNDNDVHGYLRCDYTTCWITWCNYWTTFSTN
ncbi:MAG TPA: hypothetical protein VH186_29630 [Chloroflexia bacterium]|nr:hypothetical protein [Chloroflexia bacterium]